MKKSVYLKSLEFNMQFYYWKSIPIVIIVGNKTLTSITFVITKPIDKYKFFIWSWNFPLVAYSDKFPITSTSIPITGILDNSFANWAKITADNSALSSFKIKI